MITHLHKLVAYNVTKRHQTKYLLCAFLRNTQPRNVETHITPSHI